MRKILILISFASMHAYAVEQDYAESVAMTGHAMDGSLTFDVRIARFPGQARGTLWMYAFVDGQQFGLVDESVALTNPGRTDLEQPNAVFAVDGHNKATLTGKNRSTAIMQGHLRASGLLHATAHPAAGSGNIPVALEVDFNANHKPINVRSGRIEVMGEVRGAITIDGQRTSINIPGKWHEQSGMRPRFAPAFTYLFVQGDGIGIMATKHAAGAWGYVLHNGDFGVVTGVDIDAYGITERRFRVHMQDTTSISGSATVLRQVSVPIEGKRRPGATVMVRSELGEMVGVLNDWNPSSLAD